jgi:hypothetical protein
MSETTKMIWVYISQVGVFVSPLIITSLLAFHAFHDYIITMIGFFAALFVMSMMVGMSIDTEIRRNAGGKP